MRPAARPRAGAERPIDDQVTVAKAPPRRAAPPARRPPPPPRPGPTPTPTAAPKSTRYRTTRTRWRHPLGEVFNAVDNQTGDRVVITLLHPARKLSGGHLDAARATANVLSGIIDASINGVVDLVPYPDGRIGVVTEFLNATALSEQLVQRALPAPRVIAILRQVVRALGLAHRAGVSHGALTVGSVLLHSAQGRPDAVVVTDFALQGIVAADLDIPPNNAGLQPVTPERILGLRRTEREDIYLLGCLGYTMLTGSPPFRTGNAQAVQRRHAIEDPMPIEERLRSTRLPPAGLIDVVHRCLSKEAEDRFEDMADLEAELCLAQIDADITTVWDDLSIPRVDQARRDAILRGLQSRRSSDSMVGAPAIVDIAESVPISVEELEAFPARGASPDRPATPAPSPATRKPPVRVPKPAQAAGVPEPAPSSGTRPLRIPQPRPPASAAPKTTVAAPTAPLNVHRHIPRPTPALGKAFPVDASRERGPSSDELEEQLTTPVAKAWPKPAHMQRPQPGAPSPVAPATTAPVVTRGVVSASGFSRPRAPTGAQPSVGRFAKPTTPAPASPPAPSAPSAVVSPPAATHSGEAPVVTQPPAPSLEAHLERAIAGATAAPIPPPPTFAESAPPPPETSVEGALAPPAPSSLPAPPLGAPAPPAPSSLPAPPLGAPTPPAPSSLPAPPVGTTGATPSAPTPSSLPAPPLHAPPPAGTPVPAPPLPAADDTPSPSSVPTSIPTSAPSGSTSPLLEPIDAAIDAALPTPSIAGAPATRGAMELSPPAPSPKPIFEETLQAPVRSATMAWGGAPPPGTPPTPEPPGADAPPAASEAPAVPQPAPVAPAEPQFTAARVAAETPSPVPPPAVAAEAPAPQPASAPPPASLDLGDAGATWAAGAPAAAPVAGASIEGDIEDLLPKRKPWGLWIGVAAGVAAMALGLVWLRGREPNSDTLAQSDRDPSDADEPSEAAADPAPPPSDDGGPQADAQPPAEPEPEQPAAEPEPEAEPEQPEPEPEAETPKPTATPSPRGTSRQPARSKSKKGRSSGGSSTPRVSVPSGASASELAAKGNSAFNSGQYKTAASLLEKAVRKAPGNAKYRLLLGDTYFKRGQFSKARKQYVEADELGSAAAARRITKVDAKLGG